MFGFGKKKGPVLGLDINSDSITLIQLEKTRSGIEVARFACQPTPPNTVREGLVADPETVGEVVLDLMNQADIPPSGPSPVVNIAVPAQAVVIRLMPVPTGMPDEELADVVTQEATNHVPFPISDANLDWSLMPATERTDADGVRRVDVILAAIQRSIIEAYWRMADSAGVRLGRVDISSLSVIRSLALAGYLGSSGHLSMIVNIRHDATDINVVRSAMPLFGRSIIMGVETITEAVSRSLDIHFDQALDILPELVLFGGPPQDARMGQAAQVARTVFGDIADELARSLDFYKSQVGDVKVDQVLLTGSGCMVPQLDQFIHNRLGIRTVVADSLRDFVLDEDLIVERMRPIMASLIGSAIEVTWNPSFTVDLDLNKEGRLPLLYDERATQVISQEERPAHWYKPTLYAALALLFITTSVYAFVRFFDIPNKEHELENISASIESKKKELKELSKMKQDATVLSNRKIALDTLLKRTNRWSVLLGEIQAHTPRGVQIERIIIAGKEVKVDGVAQDFSSVSNLAINLGSSPYLSQSQVEWIARHEKIPQKLDFTVSATIGTFSAPPVAGDSQAPHSQPPLTLKNEELRHSMLSSADDGEKR
ncbi:MAG TPA: type IV pilus assembly protein PilM [Candidatus Obscuribacterales bacterium]